MGRFSIRRHKRGLSDSATIITVESSMSPPQSLYGSIISNRPKNRFQKSQQSPPSPQDENRDAPSDTTKRPQRKLLRRFRLPHHHRTGSLEEKTSVTPPEQKPHFNSLPTSPDRPVGLGGRRYASRNWSDNDIRPPRSRFPYASPRGSVGSSADILLTPIRGSTAISDEDFVFLTSQDYEEIVHPQGGGAESPGSMIQTLLTGPDSEDIRPHPVLLEPIVIEPTYTPHHEPLPSESKPSPPPKLEILPRAQPDLEPEEPPTPMSSSSTSETRTITNTIVEFNPKPPGGTLAMSLAEETEEVNKEPSPQVTGVVEPTPSREPKVSFQEPRPPSTKPAGPTNTLTIDTELPSQQNIIPFPSDLESARTPTHQMPNSIATAESTEPHHTEGATWAISMYQTAEGIMLLALDCYRWLLRKGFRDDFRSCMSYWFLKELVIGFILPLCLTPIALWLLFRTLQEHGLESALL
ncbi:unnamed protein product [Rhizoctonia solani]|uniref:Transmembrane protein n=1 Tax=Rhizoctonia solani TaxID=456999 RepID=A0A8H2XZ30_9AGAM|nr:unnamed protein product [Rhizoctonia solani]CAE6527396.1 unnamed protein product [Rhizoctonia solani]